MHNGNILRQNPHCKLIHAPLGISAAPDLWMARVICIQPITLKKEKMHRYTYPVSDKTKESKGFWNRFSMRVTNGVIFQVKPVGKVASILGFGTILPA